MARLATALEIPPVLANLLVQRGIETEEEAWQFFNPKLENLHDPFLMKDMRKAVERVDLALSRGESIMVYGDYDVDGTTAVALVYSFLRRLGHKALMLLHPRPLHRRVRRLVQGDRPCPAQRRRGDHHPRLRNQSDRKSGLREGAGIDMIICDHHLPGEKIPEAVAVLDPKRADCPYPFKGVIGLRGRIQDVAGILPLQRAAFLGSGMPVGLGGGEHRLRHRPVGGRKPDFGLLRPQTPERKARQGAAVDH
ncbi:MAG: DHH family phosphoesterase [Alistipes indistinctus]